MMRTKGEIEAVKLARFRAAFAMADALDDTAHQHRESVAETPQNEEISLLYLRIRLARKLARAHKEALAGDCVTIVWARRCIWMMSILLVAAIAEKLAAYGHPDLPHAAAQSLHMVYSRLLMRTLTSASANGITLT